MKYFFDTEFIEHATGIQLVSIGIVREDGKTFYAESSTFDERLADGWVVENVLKKLKHRGYHGDFDFLHRKKDAIQLDYWNQSPNGSVEGFTSEGEIKMGLLNYFHDDKNPEFYAYYASYDWVVFARIFGRLIDKPEYFPMWVIDLKQMMWERGLTKEWKQQVCPDPEGEHDALVDAQWNLKLYNEIIKNYPSI